MGDVINLRLHRKRKDRTVREGQAAENRTKFGRSKAVRERDRAVVDMETKRLDQHRLPAGDSDTTRKK